MLRQHRLDLVEQLWPGQQIEKRIFTETLIDDYDTARKAAKRAKEPTPQARFPSTFEPEQFLSAARRSDDIAARRAALEALSSYNQALAGLAEGRGVESAKATASSFVGLAAVFAPALGIAAPLVATVAGAVERARTQAEFVRAYREATSPDPSCAGSAAQPTSTADSIARVASGTSPSTSKPLSCGPLLSAIFSFLIADTRTYYEQRVVLANVRREQVKQPTTRLLSRRINELTGRHAPPVAGAPETAEYLALAAEYRQLSVQLIDPKQPESFGSGKLPYDSAAHAELRGVVAGLRQIGEQEQKIVDELKAYYARLGDYVRLLEQTQSYLDAVGAALAQPENVDKLAGRIVELGSAVRRDGGDLRGAFLKLLAE